MGSEGSTKVLPFTPQLNPVSDGEKQREASDGVIIVKKFL
jgi:hypothetical protein